MEIPGWREHLRKTHFIWAWKMTRFLGSQQADSEAAGGFTELGKGSSGTSKDRGAWTPTTGADFEGYIRFEAREADVRGDWVTSWKLSSSEGLLFVLRAGSNLLPLCELFTKAPSQPHGMRGDRRMH